MTALLIAAPKLPKLIRLLASDQPGEVVAAAAAITRALAAAKLDWHDLVRALETPAAPERGWRYVNPDPQPQPRARNPRRFSFADLDAREARNAIREIAGTPHLSAWEEDFIGSIYEQLRTQPHRTLSDKQVRVLNKLWRRAFDPEGDE